MKDKDSMTRHPPSILVECSLPYSLNATQGPFVSRHPMERGCLIPLFLPPQAAFLNLTGLFYPALPPLPSERECPNVTCKMQVKTLRYRYAQNQGRPRAPLRLPAERLRRNARRPLVPPYHSRHDAPRLSDLPRTSQLRRKNRHQHPG